MRKYLKKRQKTEDGKNFEKKIFEERSAQVSVFTDFLRYMNLGNSECADVSVTIHSLFFWKFNWHLRQSLGANSIQ
jgi:hypothetical protein